MEDNVQSSWSLHGNKEICARYEILERVGSGTFSDVYRGRRKEDGLIVALKEVHDYQSSWREIEALQRLSWCPNVVRLYEWFWRENEDAVLVLEFLPSDLYSVINSAKNKGENGIPEAEVKAWMIQVLQGLADCHASRVIHRDLKPSNLLISADGILKLADFGQARLLEDPATINEEEYELRQEFIVADAPGERLMEDDDSVKGVRNEGEEDSPSAIETNFDDMEEIGNLDLSWKNEGDMVMHGFTSGVGTRWYRAPELLYGATIYGKEIDLWSLGCILGELLSLEPLFPGTSDIDQLSRLVKVLGSPTEENWPGCSTLPDYNKLCFPGEGNPVGLKNHVRNCSDSVFSILERLVCYDPAARLNSEDVLENKYFVEEPHPVPTHELRVPSPLREENNFSDDWRKWKDIEADSDLENSDEINVVHSSDGFCITFS